jgi:hypothetical protein
MAMETRMSRILFVLVCTAALGACTHAVVLRNAMTGETAKCGPYVMDSAFSDSQAQREARCIGDYQRQGFERVAR